VHDLRHAFRQLARSPGFTSIVVLTLAAAVGLSTTILSGFHAILLRPLPFAQPAQLVWLNETNPRQGFERLSVTYADFHEWRTQNHAFADLGAYTGAAFTLNDDGPAERVFGAHVSASLLTVLGVPPLHGRLFSADDARRGAVPSVVLSYDLWQRRYAGDPAIVGRTIRLDGRGHTVIGIMPPRFRFPEDAALWALLIVPDPAKTRGNHFCHVIGRLSPGATLVEARRELDAINARLAREFPATNTGIGVCALTLRARFVEDVETVCWVMLGAVGFVLAAACANVATLFLARSLSRRKEFAIRAAVGATRWQAVRELLVEGVVLSGISGGLGFVLSLWGLDVLRALVPIEIPYWIDFGRPRLMLVLALGTALLVVPFFTLAPAWQVVRVNIHQALMETGRGLGESRRHQRWRTVLVMVQTALAVALLTGTGLMVRTVVNLQRVDPGFNPARLAACQLSLPFAAYSQPEARRAFYEELVTRLKAQPGVESAAAVSHLPLGGSLWAASYVVAGFPEPSPGEAPSANLRVVTPGYFAAMGIPLLAGRDFTVVDRADAPPVTVIDAALVRQYFPDRDPVGQRLRFENGESEDGPWMEIVGVVGEVKHQALDHEVRPGIYLPYAQTPLTDMALVVRTAAPEPLGALPAVRRTVQSLDATLPVYRPIDMAQAVRRTFWLRKLAGQLLATFSLFAILLAAVGIAGIVAFTVVQRTQEIGVRLTLGASATEIVELVVRRGALVAGAGLGLGLLASVALTRALATQLYGITRSDPITLTASTVFFGAVALLAFWLPARRATRVNPVDALRAE